MRDIDVMVQVTLKLYCEWLNRWWDHDPPPDSKKSPYAPEQFLQYLPKEKLYGHTQVLSITHDGWYYIAVLRSTDGDEGGDHTLVVIFDENIRHITQIFDTHAQSIYDATVGSPKFLNTP